MSLSNPKQENPVNKWIEFKGSTGEFQYWDKSSESNIIIPMNKIGFIVLDELNTVTGYNPGANAGIYSNEISDLSHEQLTVKVFKSQIQITGLYKDIKDNIKAIGGKFCKSIYAALITGKDSLELVNFKLSGSGFGGWLDKKINVLTHGVKVVGLTDGQQGATKFKIPVFEGFPMPENLKLKAIEMDKQVQEYLKQYRSKQIEETEAIAEIDNVESTIDALNQVFEVIEETPQVTDPGNDLPF